MEMFAIPAKLWSLWLWDISDVLISLKEMGLKIRECERKSISYLQLQSWDSCPSVCLAPSIQTDGLSQDRVQPALKKKIIKKKVKIKKSWWGKETRASSHKRTVFSYKQWTPHLFLDANADIFAGVSQNRVFPEGSQLPRCATAAVLRRWTEDLAASKEQSLWRDWLLLFQIRWMALNDLERCSQSSEPQH